MKRHLSSYLIDAYYLSKLRVLTTWQQVRFGRLTSVTMAVDGGQVSEEKIIGRFGRVVGYWAYGYYDPSLPYQGPPLIIWSTRD